MRVKTTIPISEARKNIFKIANDVQEPGNYYTFTENGRPKAVILSAEEFESWQETIDVSQEMPDLSKDIKKFEKEHTKGEYKDWITLEELLAKEGFLIADKAKNRYGIPVKNQTAGRKRSAKNK